MTGTVLPLGQFDLQATNGFRLQEIMGEFES